MEYSCHNSVKKYIGDAGCGVQKCCLQKEGNIFRIHAQPRRLFPDGQDQQDPLCRFYDYFRFKIIIINLQQKIPATNPYATTSNDAAENLEIRSCITQGSYLVQCDEDRWMMCGACGSGPWIFSNLTVFYIILKIFLFLVLLIMIFQCEAGIIFLQ